MAAAPPPIAADEPIVEWPEGLDRDQFVLLLSDCVDACAELGHDVPFDGPQLVGWLESPIKRERALASYHIAAMRKTLGAARNRTRGRRW
jgi:hypothetical protein